MISYRNRTLIYIIPFLVIAIALAGASYFVLGVFSTSPDIIALRHQRSMVSDRFLVSLSSVTNESVRVLRKVPEKPGDGYQDLFETLVVRFNDFSHANASDKNMDDVRRSFNRLTSLLNEAPDPSRAEGRREELAEDIFEARAELEALLFNMHERMAQEASRELKDAGDARKSLVAYTTSLLGICLLVTAILVIRMRRAIIHPVDVLLKATEKVMAGESGYKIELHGRTDEFGLVFERFNSMVDATERSMQSLENRLNLLQLLLVIGSLSSEGQSLKDVLAKVSSLVASIIRKEIFTVFIHDPDSGSYEMAACIETPESLQEAIRFVEDSSLITKLKKDMAPFILHPGEGDGALGDITGAGNCLVVAPLVHEGSMDGFIVLGSTGSDDCLDDDVDTARVLASTIYVMIRNISLHQETLARLSQLSMVFELSKQITSLYIPEELLSAIASGVAGLLKCRGCIIRLKEGDMLVPKSMAGMAKDEMVVEPMPIGRGVPGWVAQNGEPMLVDDVRSLEPDMMFQMTAKRSAIVVPMIKDAQIIGTLGIIDKLDGASELIPFTRSDLELAEGFASISALAIDKAMTHAHGLAVEEEMARSEKRMKMLFDNVQNGIVVMDRDFTIKAANRYMERWADIPAEHMVGRDAKDIFHEEGDEGYICPHCAAKSAFEESGSYTVNMNRGLNYAELTAYPLKDVYGSVNEAVVVIQDTTARVLYEEDIMGLYREVMRTNEYVESLIRNSADAIVTTDLKGIVQSWNPAAESIFGFSSDEAKGEFLPYATGDGAREEHENIDLIMQGEVQKLDSFRTNKNGDTIEVSMTLSPIKDASGEIIGVSHISRDITDRKRVEKELIRRNQELSRLFFISSAMRGTLELERLLYMVLVTVTMSDGLGFNRAVLFLLDEDRKNLKSAFGVGPSSHEEASLIWDKLSREGRSLREIMDEIGEGPINPESLLDKLGVSLEVSLDSDSALALSARERRSLIVTGDNPAIPVDSEVLDKLGSSSYACVPLVSRGTLVGSLWVDNMFNQQPITDEDLRFLAGFADQVASAIEGARLFRKVSQAEAELENIFSSISDMVYFTDPDFNVRNVNQAVLDRLGMKREDVVGQKCYKVFHGTEEPLHQCPHNSTVMSLEPAVLELEDPHLNGTFISSTAPMIDDSHNFIGTVHVVRDISELRELRERLQSAERKAALGEVAAKVAHEIRNPLVSVGGFAKRLESKLEGPLKEYATIIMSEATRLEVILKDILGFVREVRMNKTNVDLNDVVLSILALMENEIHANNNTVKKELAPEGIDMFVDPARIREAIMNIVVNANQAVDGGTIIISTSQVDDMAVFEVSDTGEGVDEEIRDMIYDPFFTTRTMGTGLGLAVTKRIIEESGGRIEVDDAPVGGGAVFRVYLPLQESEYEDTGS